MPAYGNPGSSGGGGASMYEDAPDEGGTTEKSGMDKEHEEGGPTAVIPKSLLAGKEFKPGEEIMFTINSIHGDEVVISYSEEKGSKDEGGEEMGEGSMGMKEPMGGGDMGGNYD